MKSFVLFSLLCANVVTAATVPPAEKALEEKEQGEHGEEKKPEEATNH